MISYVQANIPSTGTTSDMTFISQSVMDPLTEVDHAQRVQRPLSHFHHTIRSRIQCSVQTESKNTILAPLCRTCSMFVFSFFKLCFLISITTLSDVWYRNQALWILPFWGWHILQSKNIRTNHAEKMHVENIKGSCFSTCKSLRTLDWLKMYLLEMHWLTVWLLATS